MIKSDILRQILLGVTAVVYVLVALRALLAPDRMAAGLGFRLNAPNGYSEMYAVYVGVWLATAVLALIAIFRIREPLIGDLLAMLVIAQPLGRLLALGWGVPHGTLLVMFMLEAADGLALFLVRPSGLQRL